MVMGWLATDVGMLAAWQVQALDDAELGEDLERPKDGGSADAEATRIPATLAGTGGGMP